MRWKTKGMKLAASGVSETCRALGVMGSYNCRKSPNPRANLRKML